MTVDYAEILKNNEAVDKTFPKVEDYIPSGSIDRDFFGDDPSLGNQFKRLGYIS